MIHRRPPCAPRSPLPSGLEMDIPLTLNADAQRKVNMPQATLHETRIRKLSVNEKSPWMTGFEF